MLSAPIGYRWHIIWRRNILSEFLDTYIGYVLSRLVKSLMEKAPKAMKKRLERMGETGA